jgi:hypothetical protein
MISEDTNDGDRKLKAKGFQEHKPFEGIAFKERSRTKKILKTYLRTIHNYFR